MGCRYLALPIAPGKWSTVGPLRLPRLFAGEEAVSLRMTRHCKWGNFNLTHYLVFRSAAAAVVF